MSTHSSVSPPASVADLGPFVRSRKNTRWTAHIPDDGTPLCVDRDDAFGVEWVEDTPDYYPEVDQWFSLCDRCLFRLSDR